MASSLSQNRSAVHAKSQARSSRPKAVRVRRKSSAGALDRVSVVIPVFNQAGLTAQCLQSLVGEVRAQIIVVDDASTDSTPKLLAGYGKEVLSVRQPRNGGFAQSCNAGARAASGDYVVFLNNDTIPQPGWLDALLGYAQAHPEAAAVGAKLLYPNHTIQHAGVVICQDRYPRHIYAGFPADHPAVTKSRPFSIVTAACVLVRRELFLSVGGFDCSFRNGFEDVDFCLRLGQMGRQVHYCAESVLYHLESSSPGRFRHDKANVALYRTRWINRVQPDDVKYYVEDRLLDFSYEGSFPFRMRLSPRLAVLHNDARKQESESLLGEQARQVAELTRENTRLRAELGKSSLDSPVLQYDDLRARIRQQVQQTVPSEAKVLIVSKGDGALLQLGRCTGEHFPQTETGAYAGYHPENSAAAIAHLEFLRAKGARYLVLPKTSFWWLEHYREWAEYVASRYRSIQQDAEACLIYDLRATPVAVQRRPSLAPVTLTP